MTGTPDPLHGWTLAEIRGLASMIASTHRYWWTEGTWDDHVEAASAGIVEALLISETEPSRRELNVAGTKALRSWVNSESTYRGRRAVKRFGEYWSRRAACVPGPETFIPDRVTLVQALRTLPARQRQALLAVCEYGAYAPAAESMGVTPGAVKSHVHRARAACKRLLDEGEMAA